MLNHTVQLPSQDNLDNSMALDSDSLCSRWCLHLSLAQTPHSLETLRKTMRRWWPCKFIAFGRRTINAKTISIRFHLADILIKHLGSKWYFMNLYLLRHERHPFWMWNEWCGKRSFVMLKWKINSGWNTEKNYTVYILGVIELSWYNKIKCTANIESVRVKKKKWKEILKDG